MDEDFIFSSTGMKLPGKSCPFRILPPGQGFHTADLSRKGSGNGLVVHMDMALFHGIFKIPKHKGRIHHIPAHRWIVHCPAPVPIFPDRVRRHFGHIENIPALQGFQRLRRLMVLIKRTTPALQRMTLS